MKAFLFDFDGVMVNRFTVPSAEQFCVAYGIQPELFAQASAGAADGLDTGKTSEADYFTKLVTVLALSVSSDEVRGFFEDADAKNLKRNEDMYQWVNDVAARGILIGLATNVSRGLAGRLGGMGLYDIFPKCYFSYELGMTKSDARFWHHVIADLKLEPASIGFVDDNQANVDAATSAGLQAFLFSGFGPFTEEVLTRLAAGK